MKTKVFFAIAIRIVMLFSVAIAFSFIPENIRGLLGDTPHICPQDKIYHSCGTIDPQWDWGGRHHWFYWMGVLLFLLSLANVVIGIINVVRKNYDTSKW